MRLLVRLSLSLIAYMIGAFDNDGPYTFEFVHMLPAYPNLAMGLELA